MTVRPVRQQDLPRVFEMMRALTGEEYDFRDEVAFVWQHDSDDLGGFISLSLRPWAEGCESTPVPYIEGWWVEPELRQHGVGRALMAAAEQWCRSNGYLELGSDVEVENDVSLQAHQSLGFEQTVRLQFFRRRFGRETPGEAPVKQIET